MFVYVADASVPDAVDLTADSIDDEHFENYEENTYRIEPVHNFFQLNYESAMPVFDQILHILQFLSADAQQLPVIEEVDCEILEIDDLCDNSEP